MLLSLSKWEIRFIPAGLLLSFLGIIYLGLGIELFSQWDKAMTLIFGYLPSATGEMLSLVVTLLMAIVGIGTFIGAARLKDYVNVQSLYKLTGFTLVMIALAKLIMVDGIIVQGEGLLGSTFVPFLNVYMGTVVAMLALAAIFVRISRFESWDSTRVNKDLMPLVDGIRKFGNLIFLSAVAAVLLVVVSREIMVSGLYIDLERVVLSVYWLMYALAVVALGIRWKMAKMRLIGFGLLVGPILKTFLYDVWVISPVLGFAGMFVMGCLLLGMSFVYQRNSTRSRSIYNPETMISLLTTTRSTAATALKKIRFPNFRIPSTRGIKSLLTLVLSRDSNLLIRTKIAANASIATTVPMYTLRNGTNVLPSSPSPCTIIPSTMISLANAIITKVNPVSLYRLWTFT
jgi:hypothetical protein